MRLTSSPTLPAFTAPDNGKVRQPIIKNNEVTVKNTVTKGMVDAIKAGAVAPKLTFTAYAVQREGIDTAEAAWTVATTGNLPA